jgi:hypothetical protein
MTDFSEAGSNFVRDLGEAARNNPLSAALIGMGVLWMFTGTRAVGKAGTSFERAGKRISEASDDTFEAASTSMKSGASALGSGIASAADSVQDSAASAFKSVSRVGREQAGAVAEYARSIPAAGADAVDRARSNLTELFRAQPLALGAIGLAIGAGIAAALPSSEVESDYLGEASDAVKTKAADFTTEQASRATAIAEDMVEAVSEEARKQGLTIEDAKAAVGDISGKVRRVAEAAGQGVSKRAKLSKSQATGADFSSKPQG